MSNVASTPIVTDHALASSSAATTISKQQHFRCEVCNYRAPYTDDAYAQHLASIAHRHAEVLRAHDMWPGKGSRPYLSARTDHLPDFADEQLRPLIVTERKPFWFLFKNDPRIVCLPCFDVLDSATAVMEHQVLTN